MVPDASAVTTQDIQAAGIVLTAADFDSALGEARASYSDSIGAPKVIVKASYIKTTSTKNYNIRSLL